ncbi:biliverdin-producing heme oxygenase [Caenimonas aquaedulcis]|uniref:Biliverdin-producing heme oxygenase n=1 Tax=Caenimonas aquaedulcis TaxID=2793270 RepID=A0A931H335_9BURK|nr:biliverdin-producing heme oxygenase [Caenimonas aquaedulcis]MBG9387714.1 biliverdin-producing heme oxygenase [Caenimonas aquaedulcis]
MRQPLIDALRRATSARHAEVECLLGLDAPFDMDTYTRVVSGFDTFLSSWEPRTSQALPELLRPWFAARCRGDMARRDAARLGAIAPPSPAVEFTALPGLSAALGSLYVMEGSALGGQVIARQVARQHGLHADNGAAYFNGWGERTGEMWREFRTMLEQHDAQGADHEAACAGANHTFDALIHTFRRVLHATAAA